MTDIDNSSDREELVFPEITERITGKQMTRALQVAIQDLISIRAISRDKCRNLADACLKDIHSILKGNKDVDDG